MKSYADLLGRVKMSEPTDVRSLLEEAWLEIHHEGYSPENEKDTCGKCDRFKCLLDADVNLQAATMLVPVNWYWTIEKDGTAVIDQEPLGSMSVEIRASHSDPALSLIEVSLKAKVLNDST